MAVLKQVKNLNVIPGTGAQLVVHCSLGDNGSEIEFNLYAGSEPFYPTGVASVQGTRKDGTGFGPYGVAINGNHATVTLNNVMTGVEGPAICEITFTGTDETVSTANFALIVEDAAYPEGPIVDNSVGVYQQILAYVQSFAASASAEVADETAARIAADNVLQNNIDAEATARAGTDASLQTQINQLVAPTGSAPSAAEVQNARIGANNVTYSTLGVAIRSQIAGLENELNEITEIKWNNITSTFASGKIVTNVSIGSTVDTSVVADAAWMYATVPCNSGDKFKISGTGGNANRLWAFTDANYVLVSKSDGYITVTDLELTAPMDGYLIVNAGWENKSLYSGELSAVPEEYLDEVTNLRRDLNEITENTWADITASFASGKIVTNVSIGSTVDTSVVADAAWMYVIIPCLKNDKFKLSGVGGDANRLWAFTDADYKLITKSAAYLTETDLELTAPANGYLIVNAGWENKSLYSSKLVVVLPEEYEEQVDDLRNSLNEITENTWVDITESFASGKIITNVSIGATVDMTVVTDAAWMYTVVACVNGDQFKLSGTGGNANRLWAFTDADYKLLSKSEGYITETDLVLTAPADGYLIVNAGWENKSLYSSKLAASIPEEYSDMLNNFAESVAGVALAGGNWSSDTVPDHGETTDYAAISAYYPTLAELYAAYDALMTSYPNYISKTDLGLDQSGEYHLYKYSFVPESIPVTGAGTFSAPAAPKILLGSGTHGNGQDAGDQPEMVVGVYYFIKNICNNWYGNDALTYLRHHIQIELIPVQNPWGYVNRSRRNSRGVDINRNFPHGWTLGTPGTNIYGGTEPFSEAESKIIRDFIEDNLDGLFYIDLHTTGGIPDQDKMMYYEMAPNENIIVPTNDTVLYLSDKWNHDGIPNLDTQIMHGYIYGGTAAGAGKIFEWVSEEKHIPACVMEAFPNFANSGLPNNGELVMRMCQDELVCFIIKCVRYFKFNYLGYPKTND